MEKSRFLSRIYIINKLSNMKKITVTMPDEDYNYIKKAIRARKGSANKADVENYLYATAMMKAEQDIQFEI